jgi:3-oxoacyl-[acyl-carrier-protein] synthase-1
MSSPHDIVITAMGMTSSIGLSVVGCCAAERAGVSRLREHALDLVRGEPILCCSLDGVASGFQGTALLGRLASRALSDLASNASTAKLLKDSLSTTELRIALPPPAPTPDEARDESAASEDRLPFNRRAEAVVEATFGRTGIMPPPARHFYRQEHVAPIHAIRDTMTSLSNEQATAALIAGVFSGLEEDWLVAHNQEGRLKSASTPTGLVPGEAAAFLILEQQSNALTRGARGLARVAGIGTGTEKNPRSSEEPSTAEGLVQAISGALAASGFRANEVGLVIGDLNGETYRSQEWGLALARLSPRLGGDHVQHSFPSLSFGETSSASALVGICTAIRGFLRGYARAQRALVWSSSDGEERAALCLEDLTR